MHVFAFALAALSSPHSAPASVVEPFALSPAVVAAPQDPKPAPDSFEERMKKRKEGKPREGWVVLPRYGFQMKKPAKWNQIAIQTSEEWLAAKFQCDREFLYNNKEIGFTFTQRPEMLVVAFPKAVMDGPEKEVEEKETEQGTKVVTITFKNPYKSYDDFLDRTYNSSGFFLFDKKDEVVNGVPVSKRLYKAEKLSNEGPKYIVTWLYQDEDVEYALQTEVLLDAWPKLQSLIEGTYKSFELVRRTGSLNHDGSTSSDRIFSYRDLNTGEPKERRSKRVESEKQNHDRAIAKLPEGWSNEKKGNVMALSSADPKWTSRVIAHTNNLLKWLESELGYIGPGEYVRAPIVRVCKNSEEEQSFRRGVQAAGWTWGNDGEIVTSQDDSGWVGSEIDWLNRDVLNHFLREKNPDLMISMPEWLSYGLYDAIEGARMDSGKPEFRRDVYSAERYRDAERNGGLTHPRELLVMTEEEFRTSAGSGGFSRLSECQVLVAFLISEESKRTRQAKGLLERYVKNLLAVIDEAEAEYAADLKKRLEEAKDAEEEQRVALDLRTAMRKREKTILERTFERTFSGWTEKDWDAFVKGMRASI